MRSNVYGMCLVDPARKIRIGNKLYFGEDEMLVAEVIDNTTSRGRTLRFLYDGSYEEFRKKLTQLGSNTIAKIHQSVRLSLRMRNVIKQFMLKMKGLSQLQQLDYIFQNTY